MKPVVELTIDIPSDQILHPLSILDLLGTHAKIQQFCTSLIVEYLDVASFVTAPSDAVERVLHFARASAHAQQVQRSGVERRQADGAVAAPGPRGGPAAWAAA